MNKTPQMHPDTSMDPESIEGELAGVASPRTGAVWPPTSVIQGEGGGTWRRYAIDRDTTAITWRFELDGYGHCPVSHK